MSRRLIFLSSLLLIGAFALAACGGGDDDFPDPDIVAGDALLQLSDLPAGDWDVEDSSDADDGDSDGDSGADFLASESCREVSALTDALVGDRESNETVAQREREFGRSEGFEFLQIGSEVEVHERDVDVAAGLAAAEALLAQAVTLEQCFAETMEQALSSGGPEGISIEFTGVELIDVEPLIPQSFGLGVVIGVEIAGLPLDFELQIHGIPRGRVTGTLQLIQAGSTVISEAAPEIARAFEARILSAQAPETQESS